MWELSEIAGAEKHIAENNCGHPIGTGGRDNGQRADRFQRGRADTPRFHIDCAGYDDFFGDNR